MSKTNTGLQWNVFVTIPKFLKIEYRIKRCYGGERAVAFLFNILMNAGLYSVPCSLEMDNSASFLISIIFIKMVYAFGRVYFIRPCKLVATSMSFSEVIQHIRCVHC